MRIISALVSLAVLILLVFSLSEAIAAPPVNCGDYLLAAGQFELTAESVCIDNDLSNGKGRKRNFK
jgi:hypothetical protein